MITNESIEFIRDTFKEVANRGTKATPYFLATLDMLNQISTETTDPDEIWTRLKDAIKTAVAEMSCLDRARACQPMASILRFMHTYEED